MNRPHHEVFEGSELGPWQPVGDVDVSRLDLPTKVFGAASLALFFTLQLPWYTRTTGGVPGSASAMIAGGWRWLIWLVSLASAVFVFLESVTSLRLPSFLTDAKQRGQLFAATAGVDLLLVLLAAFAAKAQPPSLVATPASTHVGTAIGAYLGLVAAIVAMAAAVQGLRAWTASVTTATAPAAPPPSAPVYGPGGGTTSQGGEREPRSSPRPPAGPAGPAQARQRPAAPGSDPPTGWMPPQPPPPPPL